MTTRNLVPRADGEGSLGTAEKQWGAMRAKKVYIDGTDFEEVLEDTLDAADAADDAKTQAAEIATAVQALYNAFIASYGYPLVASTAAAMTDTTKIYVYTGSEDGYTNGNWYYHNGTAWTSGGTYNSTAFTSDKTLTGSGAAADAEATGRIFDNFDKQINNTGNLINYGYGVGEDISPGGGTGINKIEVKRTGTMITVNGDADTGNIEIVKIKISGSFAKAKNAFEWNTGISLKSGHRYIATLRCLSANAESAFERDLLVVSVYKTTENITKGKWYTDIDKHIGYRIFDAGSDEYNLALLVYRDATFEYVNTVVSVTLQDITEASNILYKNLDTRINRMHNLIDYAYGGIEEEFIDYDLKIKRLGTILTLNGPSFTNSASQYIKISGNLNSGHNGGVIGQMPQAFPIIPGHKYKQTLYCLSESAVENLDKTSLSAYCPLQVKSLGDFVLDYDKKTFTRIFVAPEDSYVHMALYITPNASYSNAIYEATLEDITREEYNIAAYYNEEMADTVDKVRKINNSPALVFPVVTDIHRHSSNVTQNYERFMENLKTFIKNVKCDFVACLGDITDGIKQQAITLQWAHEITQDFANLGILYIFAQGNHDNNAYISSGALKFSIEQVFSAYFTATKGVTYNIGENGTDYYIDFDNLNIRLLVINSCNVKLGQYAFGSSTEAWLASALDTNKTVILLEHLSSISSQVWNNPASRNREKITSVLQSFVNNGGNLIQISGHSHTDMAFVDPWVSVMQVCQKFKKTDLTDSGFSSVTGYVDEIVAPDRTAGTASEDAWSVCVYKPTENELYVIRFGAGSDRIFHVTPVAPTTFVSQLTDVTWNSSNTDVATVYGGTVTGVGTGKCAILAKDTAGNYECWIVQVD